MTIYQGVDGKQCPSQVVLALKLHPDTNLIESTPPSLCLVHFMFTPYTAPCRGKRLDVMGSHAVLQCL